MAVVLWVVVHGFVFVFSPSVEGSKVLLDDKCILDRLNTGDSAAASSGYFRGTGLHAAQADVDPLTHPFQAFDGRRDIPWVPC